MPDFIHIHPTDNVAVALAPIPKGTVFAGVTALEDIPQGHKMALQTIPAGGQVMKYGLPIGHSLAQIPAGSWVHTHNMATNLSGEVEYCYNPKRVKLEPLAPRTFLGYRRPDGRAATRNEIWIIPTVGCVNDVAKTLVRDNQDLVTGSIDGLYTFPHPFGCSQTGHDHAQTRKLLAALTRHPNAGAVLVLSLGCENLTHEQFLEEQGPCDPERVNFLTCQQVEDEFEAARGLLEQYAAYAARFQRQELPVSELVVGMKCGGSDGLSGITANPTVGRFSDLLVAMGGSTVLTEVPEMFGAESFLLDRCVDETVFRKTSDMLNGFKSYFIRHGEVVYDNPSPGNKQGGITTLEDKSCGCVQKGGSAPIVDVIGYAEPVTKKGLNLLYGPGNDLVSATALTAAGAHLILFTTGRGTLCLGINDSHHEHGKGGDGEDPTGVIPLGTPADRTTATYCGAWNVVLDWLQEHRPYAHLGILVTNGCDRPAYREAQLETARRHGVPWIDLNGDQFTPAMIRSQNPEVAPEVKERLRRIQAVDYPRNTHPNDEAQVFESSFIEAFLRRL